MVPGGLHPTLRLLYPVILLTVWAIVNNDRPPGISLDPGPGQGATGEANIYKFHIIIIWLIFISNGAFVGSQVLVHAALPILRNFRGILEFS